jgi:glycosyltransferase involved in cell wall biosynthesis
MKVSVLMPTYMHEKYISQAIESFLAQKCTYTCELLINDDCSKDKTAEIAAEYANKYPEKVKFFAQKENKGLLENYRFLLSKASGDYIAILESDDYWTDQEKLEKQISFLENNQEYGLSFTGWTRDRDGIQESYSNDAFLSNLSTSEAYKYILLRNIIRAVTVVFRRSEFDKYCNIDNYIDNKFITFDYPVWLSILAHNKVHYLPECTAVYREIGTSISNASNLGKRLNFERETYKIRRYIINLYGSAGLSASKIRLREAIVLSRIAWRARSPYKATYLFFSHLLGF